MDRWSLVATLNYLSIDAETNIVLSKAPLKFQLLPLLEYFCFSTFLQALQLFDRHQ